MGRRKAKGRRKRIVFAVLIILLVSAGYSAYYNYLKTEDVSWSPAIITKDNLPQQLEGFSAVKELPLDSRILLKIGDYGYVINGNNVGKVEQKNSENDYDISISLPEGYFDVVSERGWCDSIKIAKENKELVIEIASGKEGEILWKYKGLAKYRGCLE